MLSSQLQHQLEAYLDHKITIDQLQEWYVQRIPSLTADPDSDDAEAIAELELRLFEWSQGDLTEPQLHVRLHEFLLETSLQPV